MSKFKRIVSILVVSVILLSTSMNVPAATGFQSSFVDVDENAWYAESVQYMKENKYMNGMTDTMFAPEAAFTRAMFVTTLAQMENVDESRYTKTSFKDVSPKSWYGCYVEWAFQNKIVSGYTADRFAPDVPITREQMATIFARYVKTKRVPLLDSEKQVSSFKDSSSVSSWAREGLELMRRTGLIVGGTDGKFRPQDSTTRAEAASVFTRFDKAMMRAVMQMVIDHYNTITDTNDYIVFEHECEKTDTGYFMILRYRGGSTANKLVSGITVNMKDGKVTDDWGDSWYF